MNEPPAFSLACPACRTPLTGAARDQLCCPNDGLTFERRDGVWRMLLPGREAYFEQFNREYETVRRAEGRGSRDPDYYRSLPFQDLSGRMQAAWNFRAASYKTFLQAVLVPLEKQQRRALNVMDLGSGCGWLSYRMALAGHRAAAVDLATNDFDGLGCWRFYQPAFTALQAEFNHLPLAMGTADLMIYNASFHYAADYSETLAEARRVLKPGGQIVIMDTPVYHDPLSGAKMIQEREEFFQRHFGFLSNAIPMKNFLTYPELADLAKNTGLHVRLLTPAYGLRWALRPLVATLRRQREPAKFHLIVLD